MTNPNPQKVTRVKKHRLRRFLLITAACVSVGMLTVAAAFWFLTGGTSAGISLPVSLPGNFAPALPKRTTFAILGLDADGTRADTIIVGAFNSETGAIDLLSVPRDTYVQMPDDRLEALRAAGRWVPSDGVMKINTVHHYAGKELGVSFTIAQLEDLLGVKIDYSARVNLDAFRFVVDAIGGVTFDVPQRMYYRDPEQNLYIDLYPGPQTLTGAQAEQLVRYRKPDLYNPISEGYAAGDLQRVEVQQAFLKALISQATAKKNLFNTTGALITTLFKYVDTDFSITDVPKYVGALPVLSPDKISCMTLPGDTQMVKGQSYVVMREPDASDMLDSVFGSDDVIYESSFAKKIIILNGGETKGKANETRKTLEDAGYMVTGIGDHTGGHQDATRICVRKRGQGTDLIAFFQSAEIVIDPQTDCDIKIIVGSAE